MDARKNGPAFGAGLVLAAAVLWGTVGPAQVLAAGPMAPAGGGCALILAGMITTCLPTMPRGRSSARATEFPPDRRITFAEKFRNASSGERDAETSLESRTSA